jgi:cell division protein FtsI (penicillin-binding protein 3)
MVSLPDFDPNRAGSASPDSKFNRASLGVFEMGSTMKLFSTAAALDSGLVNFNTAIDTTQPIKYGRFSIDDYHAKKRVLTVPEIFMYSSNIGTARMALSVGNKDIEAFYRRLGFMSEAQIDLPERGRPIYPRPWRDISTLTTSFGHGIAISPVHLMQAASALANGGLMVHPRISLADKTLAPVPPGERIVKPETAEKIRKLLALTVAAGTGSHAKAEGYDVGGKTGTAEKNSGGRYTKNLLLSSFVGVFPIMEPRYVVLALVDEPKGTKESFGYATGGWTAAPVVGSVIAQMAPLYGMAPIYNTNPDTVREMTPYVRELREKKVAGLGTDR